MRHALALPAFRSLLAAYAISQLGDWAAEVALAVVLYNLTHAAGAVAAAWLIHRCLLGLATPLLAARAQHHSPRRLLPGIALAQTAIYLVLAAGADAFGLAAILALVAADGLLAPLSRTLVRSAIAHITQPAGLLAEGNAAVNLAFTTNALLASALGGILTAVVGAPAALAFNAVTFLAAAGLLAVAALPAHLAGTDGGTPQPQPGAWTSLRQAVGYVRATRPLGLLLVSDAAFLCFALAVNPVEVALVKDSLHASDAAYGVTLAAWGVGMIAGGGLVTRAQTALGQLAVLAGGVALQGLALLAIAAAGSVSAMVALSALGGIGNGLYGVLSVTAVQQRTAERFQTCVSALMEALATAATAMAFIAGGAVATLAGPRPVFALAGAGSLAVLLAAAARQRAASTARPRTPRRTITATAP